MEIEIVAYLIYAFCQGIVIVSWMEIKSPACHAALLLVVMAVAPMMSVFVVYMFLNDATGWLQSTPEKKK